jgi:LacI family transcriptional regulator
LNIEVDTLSKKRVTSFDVARKAGVSRSLVSAVLNNTQGIGVSAETRQAVLEAIEELNYHVDAQARSMKTGRSYCIAAYGDTRNPLFLQVLEGMQQACAEQGYHILLSGPTSQDKERSKLLELFLQKRIDGIVTLDTVSYKDKAWAEEVKKSQVPFISIEGYAEVNGIASVLVDYKQSILDALDYLSLCSKQAPVYIQVYMDDSLHNWGETSRRDAYLEWCNKANLQPVIQNVEMGDEDGFIQFVKRLHATGQRMPPLLSNWSYGATWTYRAAMLLGLKVGEDLQVIAADNTLRINRFLVPSLTVMEIPYSLMGQRAVEVLLQQIEGKASSQRIENHWLKAELILGESTQYL